MGFIEAIRIILKSAESPAMKAFHSYIGMNINLFNLKEKIVSLFFILFSFFIFKFIKSIENNSKIEIKKKFLGYFLFILLVIFYKIFIGLKEIFCFLPIVIFAFSIINFKKIIKKPEIFALVLCSIFASIKTFFYLNLGLYGEYTIMLLLASLFILLYKVNDLKNNILLNFVFIFSIIFFATSVISKFAVANYKINSNYKAFEKLEMLEEYQKVSLSLLAWIEVNTNIEDKILVFPEGEIIPYLSSRKTDLILYSLHDVFIETFGVEFIKKQILDSGIKYIFDISEFGYNGAILSKHTYKTNYIINLLNKEFHLVFVIPVKCKNADKKIMIYQKNKKPAF